MIKFQEREEDQGKLISKMNTKTKNQISFSTTQKIITTQPQSQWKRINPSIMLSIKLQTMGKKIHRLLIAWNAKKHQLERTNLFARSH